MFVCREKNAGRSHNIEIDDSFFERVAEFKYLGTTLINQNSVLKSGNACYYSVQNLFSSSLLSKNAMIKVYRTIILAGVYGCETWLIMLRVLRIFGCKRDVVTGVEKTT